MFAQATPQIQAPVGGYVLVTQPQRMNYIAQAPLMIQMPIIQKPLQPAIPYEKFLPPTPKLRQEEPPKLYQFYRYVPATPVQTQQVQVTQTVPVQVQPVMQSVQPMTMMTTLPTIVNTPITQ